MHLEVETGSEAYQILLSHLVEAKESSPRGEGTRELLNVSVTIRNANEAHVLRTTRKVNRKIAATEIIHLMGGVSNLPQLDAASGGRFNRYADNGRLRGAYGPRISRQLMGAVNKLKRDIDTRQAVVSIWDGYEQLIHNDVPCTQAFQFLARGGKLHMRVAMRSSDVFLGIPYDWLMFSRLQQVVAADLNLEVGSYTHTAGSQHLYERNVEDAWSVIDGGTREPGVVPMPLLGVPDVSYLGGHLSRQLERSSWLASAVAVGATLGDPPFGDERPLLGYSPDVLWYLDKVPQIPHQRMCVNCRYIVGDEDFERYHDDYQCDECVFRQQL